MGSSVTALSLAQVTLARHGQSAHPGLGAPPEIGELASARRRRNGPQPALTFPRRMILPGENPERHKLDTDKVRAPRPLGVAPGMPWEPRTPTRSHAWSNVTIKFLEALEDRPELHRLASSIVGKLNPGATRGDTPLPPDVASIVGTGGEPGAWKFAALGDYGAGSVMQARVAANILSGKPEVVVTAGDNVYPTGRWEDYAKNFDPPHLAGNLSRNTRFMPALGNHDMYRDDLRPYFGHFPHLEGRTYYAFTHKNAHFMALDTDQDIRPGSAQYRWLEQELRASTKRWKIVYMHYPSFGHDAEEFREVRESLQPLLARYGVQLAIAGHEHNYMRSKPQAGVTHVLTGGGGQAVFPFSKPQPAWTARRVSAFHHVEVEVGAARMVLRAIDEWGKRIDTTVIPVGKSAARGKGVERGKGGSRRALALAVVPSTSGVRPQAREAVLLHKRATVRRSMVQKTS